MQQDFARLFGKPETADVSERKTTKKMIPR